jgi:hypothetical protein
MVLLEGKRTWTAVIVIAIVAVAAVAYTEYQYNNAPISRCESDAEQGDSMVGYILITPVVNVAQGASTGNMTVRLSGSGCAPISGFVITAVRPFLSGVIDASFLDYQGRLVTAAHPEPVDEPASGSINLSNVSAAQSYTFTYKITLATNDPEFTSQEGNITVYA